MKHLLDTGNGADVQFFLLLAHKLILMAAFDAFEAMFRFDAQNAKAVVGGKGQNLGKANKKIKREFENRIA
uniref:Uncharacterized protein n=1 Tax=Globodera rostochiensis TaxID=31243 RepID=A0A914HXB0_GLORO